MQSLKDRKNNAALKKPRIVHNIYYNSKLLLIHGKRSIKKSTRFYIKVNLITYYDYKFTRNT